MINNLSDFEYSKKQPLFQNSLRNGQNFIFYLFFSENFRVDIIQIYTVILYKNFQLYRVLV